MTDSSQKIKLIKFLKITAGSFVIVILLLFTAASLRILSLDVNVGLQLAQWEKTNNITLVIDDHQREELLTNFKGNVPPVTLRVSVIVTEDMFILCVCSSRSHPDPHGVSLGDGDQHHRAAAV